MSASSPVQRRFTVGFELGLHARPAGAFVALANRFDAKIEVARSDDADEWVDGTSILSLLSLAASMGTQLELRGVGPEAEKAIAALGRLVEDAGRDQEPAA